MSHHDHTSDLADLFTRETWDARYSESDRIWSGNPNPRLVEHVSNLPPGDALDIGAGEGGDSVWLASQGWNVTALDVSTVALGRTAAHAADAGLGERVRTREHDLLGDQPLPGTYDLVSAQFMHPPADRLAEIVTRMGEAVRVGGVLLVVGHHPDDFTSGRRDAHGHPELLYTPDQLVATLDPRAWEVRVADAPTREVGGPDGPELMTDTVVLAARR